MDRSDELVALDEADILIKKQIDALYEYSNSTSIPFLPSDAVTQAAFSALCGARRYIARELKKHITGEKPEE